MFTVNFENMNDAEGYTLDQIFPYNSGMKSGQTANAGDWIRTWNPDLGETGGYDTQYFMYRRGSNALNYHWVYMVGSTPTAAPIKVKSGMCFWYYKQASQDTATEYPIKFQVAGQVEYTQSGAVITIKPGLNMIGAPFAANLDLNTLGSDYWQARYNAGEVKAGQTANAGDWVRSWDPTSGDTGGYSTQYFLYRRGSNALNYNWVYMVGSTPTKAPEGFIKMGTGAWYNCGGTGFTLPIPYPYDLNK